MNGIRLQLFHTTLLIVMSAFVVTCTNGFKLDRRHCYQPYANSAF